MIYIAKRGGPVSVMIPVVTDGEPSSMKARSTVNLEEYEVLRSDLGKCGSYRHVAAEFPPDAQYGEYEYFLYGPDGRTLSTGLAVLAPPVEEGREYENDITFRQYGE